MGDSKTIFSKGGGLIAFPNELAGQEVPRALGAGFIRLPKIKSPTVWIWAAIFILATVGITAMAQLAVLPKDPLATGQLMNAVQYGGDAAMVKSLLEKGADINAKDNDGWTALQHAAKRGDVEIVRLLLENGADANARSNDGGTSLMSAAKRDYIEIMKLLLEKGADINAKIENTGTALDFAAWAGQTNAIVFLLDHHADIEATNNFGSTSLMDATAQGQTEAVKVLVARGANVNAEDTLGSSALDEANRIGNPVLVRILQQAGAIKSSGMARDESISNDLKNLQQINEQLSNSLRNAPPTAATTVTAPLKPEFEIISITAKPTVQNSAWWRYGYRLTVRNNGLNPGGQWFEIQFLDAQGYVIDTAITGQKIIQPGGTETVTGEKLIYLPGAAKVADAKAFWKNN
jgi:ankyrin repeat protein